MLLYLANEQPKLRLHSCAPSNRIRHAVFCATDSARTLNACPSPRYIATVRLVVHTKLVLNVTGRDSGHGQLTVEHRIGHGDQMRHCFEGLQ